MITIVHGPEASGKTKNAEILQKHYNAKRVVEEFPLGGKLEDGDLLLTNNIRNFEFDNVTIPIQIIPIVYALQEVNK